MNKEQSPESLLAALKAERASAKAAREELESLNRRIGERDRELTRLAGIDPHKYAELSAWQQELEEQELRENQDWGKLKANYQKEKGDLNTQIQTWQNKYQGLLTQQAIKDAFLATGGITKADDGEVSPLDLVTQYFADRVQVKDEKIILLDRAGNPESVTLVDKMLQLKRGSMGSLFQSDSKKLTASQSRPANSQQIIYTQEQARAGKADLKLIAQGKAVIR